MRLTLIAIAGLLYACSDDSSSNTATDTASVSDFGADVEVTPDARSEPEVDVGTEDARDKGMNVFDTEPRTIRNHLHCKDAAVRWTTSKVAHEEMIVIPFW